MSNLFPGLLPLAPPKWPPEGWLVNALRPLQGGQWLSVLRDPAAVCAWSWLRAGNLCGKRLGVKRQEKRETRTLEPASTSSLCS